MKKCPNCQKEFPDTMRFCQTDGTPLVEAAPAEDPLKTTVVRQEDIASAIPPSDPFKTVVASSDTKEDSGDLLQLPEEFDPLKTMVAAPIVEPEKPILEEPTASEPPKFEAIKEEIKAETPVSPFSGFSQPSEPLPEAPTDYSNDPTLFQPEPPKFSEPSVTPPPFGDSSAKEEVEEDLPQTVLQNPWDAGNLPKSEESPFSKPFEPPTASPFEQPKSSFDAPPVSEEPQSPFNQPSSPFDAPQSPFDAPKESPFNQPQQTPFEQPQSSYQEPQQTPFQQPQSSYQEPVQFGGGQSQFDQMNQGFGNQPLQQNEWTPPPSPESAWQNQGIGSNTPLQPPAVTQGQNQTLPIVSLVFAGLSLCCYLAPITGLVAAITGFLGMKNANDDPNQYGGKGLAIAGLVIGALMFLVGILWYVLIFLGVLSNMY